MEVLHDVMDRMGWDSSQFRAYRCRIEYPLFAGQYTYDFELPEAPWVASSECPPMYTVFVGGCVSAATTARAVLRAGHDPGC